jgi:hypothetical protein
MNRFEIIAVNMLGASMYNSFLANPPPFIKQNPSGASHRPIFSKDSYAIVRHTMPIQLLLKFPGGRIAALEFPDVTSLADVKRSLSRIGCHSSLNLQNSRFLRQGRALSGSHAIHNGDIICIVPRLLGGVTPRGQPDRGHQEPNSQLLSGFAPFSIDEAFGFGSRYAFRFNMSQKN